MTATCAILTTLTRRAPRHDQLGGTVKTPESTQITRTILANSWDVQNPESLRTTLAWLRDQGHRSGHQSSPNDGLGPRGLLAWDLGRLVAVAGWGYVADYISEQEAWSFIVPAAAQLQQAYQSWEDYGQAYVKGAYAFDANAGADCDPKYQMLITDSQSPWRTVPWNTALGAVPAAEPFGAQLAASVAAGSFSVGNQQLQVKVGGMTPANFVKNKVSSMIWGWIIGGIILVVAVVGLGGLGIYIYMSSKSTAPSAGVASAKWDGKSPFSCSGNDDVTFAGVTANVSGTAITATGNCHITMAGVNITAATGIDASGNAKVTMTGGSITATTNSVVASAAAQVNCVGTKVTGKSKTSGAAKVTGAN